MKGRRWKPAACAMAGGLAAFSSVPAEAAAREDAQLGQAASGQCGEAQRRLSRRRKAHGSATRSPRLSGENSARLVKIVLKIQAATLGCGSPTGIPSFATSQLKTFFNLLHFSE